MDTRLIHWILGIPAVFLLFLWASFVLKTIWGWILVPAFGWPEISLAAAWGIIIIISYLTHQYRKIKDEEMPEYLLQCIFEPAVVLVLAFFVKQFI